MESASRIRTRRVHYISGFDPRGARYYHQLYREECLRQSALNAGKLEVGKRASTGEHEKCWQIEAMWGEERVVTEYQFLEWDDIVRQYWGGGILSVLLRGFKCYTEYGWCGALRKVCQISKNAFNCAFYPWLYLCATLSLACLLGLMAGGLVFALSSNWLASYGVAGAAGIIAAIAGAIHADRFGIIWMIRTYIFVLAWGAGKLPDLEERLKVFSQKIVAAQKREPVDEILIIGHSVGTMAAATVAARILRDEKASANHMHLLTLGSCIPFLSLIPKAAAFREDLDLLGNDSGLRWTDVAVPSDPLCFYQVHPLEASGLKSCVANRPRQFVARIFRMFRPETYAKLRRNKLRIHFQYLMAAELPSEYDYFRITAGPEKLSLSD